MAGTASPRVGLERLLSELRGELEESERARISAGQPPLLQLDQVEIRLKFVVAEKSDEKAGFDLKVISLGESESFSQEEVQEIVLTFKVPEDAVRKGVLGARHYGDKDDAPDVSPVD